MPKKEDKKDLKKVTKKTSSKSKAEKVSEKSATAKKTTKTSTKKISKTATKKTAEKTSKKVVAKKVEKKTAAEKIAKTSVAKKGESKVSKTKTAVKKIAEKTKKIVSKKRQREIIFSIASKEMYFYATGKRKSSIARVRIFQNGSGKIEVNGKKLEDYFFGVLISKALEPFKLIGDKKDFDATIKITGGGTSAQSEAARHGIALALTKMNAQWRLPLKKAGFLTRDARVKERKKPGLKSARRSPQWAKR